MFVAVYLKERTLPRPGRPAVHSINTGKRVKAPSPPRPATVVFEFHYRGLRGLSPGAVYTEYYDYVVPPNADNWYKTELWYRVLVGP